MTNLQLKNSEIIVGVDFTNNKKINKILETQKRSAFLLYPGQSSFNLSSNNGASISAFLGSAPTLFILDGTWPCVKKMLRLSKNLQSIKRVSFNCSIKSQFIFKQQPAPLCLSTIESVHVVISLLKSVNFENCDTSNFLLPFEKMVENQIEHVINPNNKKNQIGTRNHIKPKNSYKKTNQRNILFE